MKVTLEAARRSYAINRGIFDKVLAIVRRSDETVLEAPTPLAHYGAVHLSKAYVHGVALGKVLPAVPGSTAQLHDFASAAVLVRSLAETYLAFRYACVEPTTPEDIAFRDALMHHHHLYKRHAMLSHWSGDAERVRRARLMLDEAAARLRGNSTFAAQPPGIQQQQLRGKRTPHRELTDIARDASITPELWISFYIFVSQFEHSSPLAMLHLLDFRADEPAGPYNLAYLAQMASCFLARFVWELSNLYRQQKPPFSLDDVQFLIERMSVLERARPSEVPPTAEEAVD